MNANEQERNVVARNKQASGEWVGFHLLLDAGSMSSPLCPHLGTAIQLPGLAIQQSQSAHPGERIAFDEHTPYAKGARHRFLRDFNASRRRSGKGYMAVRAALQLQCHACRQSCRSSSWSQLSCGPPGDSIRSSQEATRLLQLC